MDVRASLRTSTQTAPSWNSTNETYVLSNDSYWADRNETIDANTKCHFLFSTLGDQEFFKDHLIYLQLIPALILMLFFAFVARSGRPLRDLLRCRAAVPVPVNLSEQRHLRGLNCAAFGIAIFAVIQIIFSGKSIYEWGFKNQVHAMTMILNCFLTGVVYWPVMAAINTSYFPGQIIGCLYIWWVALGAVLISLPCEFALSDTIMVGIEMLPLWVFLLYICIAMPIRIYHGIQERRQKNAGIGSWLEQNKTLYQVLHAKRMMRLTKRKRSMQDKVNVAVSKPLNVVAKLKEKAVNSDINGTTVEEKAEEDKTREEKDLDAVNENEKKILNARFYKNLPGFRYSLHILVAITITQTAVFLLAVSGFRYHTVLLNAAIRFIEALSTVMTATPTFLTGNKSVPVIEIAKQLDQNKIRGYARTPIFASIIVAYLLNLLAVLLTMRNYRKHLVYLYHGQHVKIPEYNKTRTPAAILTDSTRYIGYQLGYGIYAYFVQMFWLILIFGGIWTNIILIFVYGRTEILLALLKYVVPVIAYILVMKMGQKYMIYYFFCQKCDKRKDDRVLAIDNRHCFMNYDYFMVFLNAPLGIFNAFGRVVKLFMFNLWTMPRCDIPSLNNQFEYMDTGFRVYVCMLMMENATTNPLLVVFAQHLLDSVHHEHLEDKSISSHDEEQRLRLHSFGNKRHSTQLPTHSKLARNRWHLAYTLYHNPTLRAYRSHVDKVTLPMNLIMTREPGTLKFTKEEQLVKMRNDNDDYNNTERRRSHDIPQNGEHHATKTIIRITQNPRKF